MRLGRLQALADRRNPSLREAGWIGPTCRASPTRGSLGRSRPTLPRTAVQGWQRLPHSSSGVTTFQCGHRRRHSNAGTRRRPPGAAPAGGSRAHDLPTGGRSNAGRSDRTAGRLGRGGRPGPRPGPGDSLRRGPLTSAPCARRRPAWTGWAPSPGQMAPAHRGDGWWSAWPSGRPGTPRRDRQHRQGAQQPYEAARARRPGDFT